MPREQGEWPEQCGFTSVCPPWAVVSLSALETHLRQERGHGAPRARDHGCTAQSSGEDPEGSAEMSPPSPPRLRDRRTDALQDNPEVLGFLSKLRNLNFKDTI